MLEYFRYIFSVLLEYSRHSLPLAMNEFSIHKRQTLPRTSLVNPAYHEESSTPKNARSLRRNRPRSRRVAKNIPLAIDGESARGKPFKIADRSCMQHSARQKCAFDSGRRKRKEKKRRRKKERRKSNNIGGKPVDNYTRIVERFPS